MLAIKRSWVEAGLTIVTYLLFFLTPLTFTFITRELFEFPKMIIVYFGTTLLTFLYLVLKGGTLPQPVRLLKPFLILFLAQSVSTLFSGHLYTSFWGYYSRFNGGLASLMSYLLLYLVLSQILNQNRRNLILGALLSGGFFISAYAFLQNLGVDKNFWLQDSQARTFSTLGQPNWLAAYLLMILPLAFYFYLQAQRRSTQVVYFFLTLLFYFALWSTYSLSGFLGLGLLIALLTIFSRDLIWPQRRRVLFLISFIILVSLSRPGIFGAKVNSLYKIIRPQISQVIPKPALAAGDSEATKTATAPRVRAIDTGDIRLSVWLGALNLWKSSPKNFLIGSGPETFAYAFLPFRPASLNQTTEWDFLYNKAHNYYLDLLSGSGLLGFFAFGLFCLAVIKKWWRSRAFDSSTQSPLGNFFFYGWATTFVTNFFGWPTVALSLLFFTYPLFIGRLEDGPETQNSKGETLKGPARFWLLFIPFFLTAVLIFNIFLADVSFSQGLSLSQKGELGRAESSLRDAASLNFFETAYHKELSFVLAQEAILESGNSTQFVSSSGREAEIALALNPNNSLSLRTILRTAYLLSKLDPAYQEKLEKLLIRLVAICPTDPQSRYDAAVIYSLLEKNEESKKMIEAALKLKPDYTEASEFLNKLNKKGVSKEL